MFSGNASLSTVDDFYNGKVVTFPGMPVPNSATVIDYVGASRTFTVSPALSATPAPGATFQVLLNSSADVPITPAFIGIGDRANEVVLRFADRLPDDLYRIHIVGSGGSPLVNTAGQPFNGGAEFGSRFPSGSGNSDRGRRATAGLSNSQWPGRRRAHL